MPTPEPAPEPNPMPTPEPAPEPGPSPVPAPEPAPAPAGPVTLERIQSAWPQILQTLEGVSRASWLVATTATPVGFSDTVLTLSFASAADVDKFKKLQAGAGPSEDLRQAIHAIVGIRVKYIARHGGGKPGPRHPDPGDGPTPDDDPDPVGPPPTRQAAAPVTDWAVASIPADPGGSAQLAVDDDPEDAAPVMSRVSTLAPPREGDVLPRGEAAPFPDEDGDADEDDFDAPQGAVPVVAAPIAPTATIRDDGIERVGEAVIRQVLGARFVREEPFESATRFR
jgi:DNA polymerase-3 subunit gamma/tau